MPAETIRWMLPRAVWDGSLTFAVERNPFDRTISSYHSNQTFQDRCVPRIGEWIAPRERVSNEPLYAVGDRVIVDLVMRYESLPTELEMLSERLGVDVALPEYRAKGATRQDRRPTREVLSAASIDRIRRARRRDIDVLGYDVDHDRPGATPGGPA